MKNKSNTIIVKTNNSTYEIDQINCQIRQLSKFQEKNIDSSWKNYKDISFPDNSLYIVWNFTTDESGAKRVSGTRIGPIVEQK